MAWSASDKSIENFWNEIGPREPANWGMKERTPAELRKEERETQDIRAALEAIVGPRITGRIYNIKDADEQLWKPREILAPILRGRDRQRSAELANWIVYHWGRIHAGANDCPQWIARLNDFSEPYVFKFAEEMDTRRISSWSKVLSFADHRTYPIYDARTAISVNVAVARRGGKQFLFMPGTQNTKIPDAMLLIHKKSKDNGYWAQKDWNYLAYMYLLRRVVKLGFEKSILDAEATLYANAPKLAEEWVADNKRLFSKLIAARERRRRERAAKKAAKLATAKAKT